MDLLQRENPLIHAGLKGANNTLVGRIECHAALWFFAQTGKQLVNVFLVCRAEWCDACVAKESVPIFTDRPKVVFDNQVLLRNISCRFARMGVRFKDVGEWGRSG